MSRAKDANGNIQPEQHDENYATYVINHLLPIEVTVGRNGNGEGFFKQKENKEVFKQRKAKKTKATVIRARLRTGTRPRLAK